MESTMSKREPRALAHGLAERVLEGIPAGCGCLLVLTLWLLWVSTLAMALGGLFSAVSYG